MNNSGKGHPPPIPAESAPQRIVDNATKQCYLLDNRMSLSDEPYYGKYTEYCDISSRRVDVRNAYHSAHHSHQEVVEPLRPPTQATIVD